MVSIYTGINGISYTSVSMRYNLERNVIVMPKTKPSYRKRSMEKVRLEWYDLDLTNKVLLFIGLILLFELIFSIFIRTVNVDATTDAFFRISLSSVMGYFLGCTNTNHANTKKGTNCSLSVISEEQIEQMPIDLQTLNPNAEKEKDFEHMPHIRTLFIAFVCLACIITLSVTTFANRIDYVEGLIQLRNIISTTLGFLISKANRRN